jgi:protein-S-isoprenylcysteine O-methyltransferase Ste14
MLKKVYSKLSGLLFVAVQFGGILYILCTGPVFPSNYLMLIMEGSGFILGIWAILSMKPDNVRILPDIKTGAILTGTGPYALIRHPMYSAILLFLLPLVINKFTLIRLLIFILIFIDLLFKSIYEENLLKRHFDNYKDYTKRTYRFIPFIF